MKLLTPAAERPAFWLFAGALDCPDCGVRFSVGPTDVFRRVSDGRAAALDCPYCHRALLAFPGLDGAAPLARPA